MNKKRALARRARSLARTGRLVGGMYSPAVDWEAPEERLSRLAELDRVQARLAELSEQNL